MPQNTARQRVAEQFRRAADDANRMWITETLAHLRYHWTDPDNGPAYFFGFANGKWTATRADNRQVLTATEPDELRGKIADDHAAKPVKIKHSTTAGARPTRSSPRTRCSAPGGGTTGGC